MSWIDNLPGLLGWGVGGGLGFKWVLDFWREERAAKRGENSESVALKNLKSEVTRLAERVEALEKDVSAKEMEVKSVQAELDEQRRLRRIAEDELDHERRSRRDLELRVALLEKKT